MWALGFSRVYKGYTKVPQIQGRCERGHVYSYPTIGAFISRIGYFTFHFFWGGLSKSISKLIRQKKLFVILPTPTIKQRRALPRRVHHSRSSSGLRGSRPRRPRGHSRGSSSTSHLFLLCFFFFWGGGGGVGGGDEWVGGWGGD